MLLGQCLHSVPLLFIGPTRSSNERWSNVILSRQRTLVQFNYVIVSLMPTLAMSLLYQRLANVGIKHWQLLIWPKFTVGWMPYKCWPNVEAMSCRIMLSQRWLSRQNYVGLTLENRWKKCWSNVWLLKLWIWILFFTLYNLDAILWILMFSVRLKSCSFCPR